MNSFVLISLLFTYWFSVVERNFRWPTTRSPAKINRFLAAIVWDKETHNSRIVYQFTLRSLIVVDTENTKQKIMHQLWYHWDNYVKLSALLQCVKTVSLVWTRTITTIFYLRRTENYAKLLFSIVMHTQAIQFRRSNDGDEDATKMTNHSFIHSLFFLWYFDVRTMHTYARSFENFNGNSFSGTIWAFFTLCVRMCARRFTLRVKILSN